MIIRPWHQDPRNQRTAAVVAGVVALHAGLFASLAIVSPETVGLPNIPAVEVELVRIPVPPPPPPPPESPKPQPQTNPDAGGGGQRAAPSIVHTPPKRPPEIPTEIIAPVEKAPEQPLVIGVAPKADPEPGMGTGGQGTGSGGGSGSGTGTGVGSGSGAGVRAPPRNIRRPGNAELRRFHPQEALRQRISGVGVIRCRIKADTTLDRCQVVSESPSGMGFGPAAVQAATNLYRFRPATLNGQYDDSVTVNVVVEFGPQGAPVG